MKSAKSFTEFCTQCEQEALIEGNKGAARNYKKIRQKINAYLPSGSLLLTDIDEEWVRSFNEWLYGLGHEKTTISFYNRSLRAVYNKAVKKKIIRNTHPFDDAYTKVHATHYPIAFDGDDKIPFETISHEELLRRYKSLAYKYNAILRQIKGIMTV